MPPIRSHAMRHAAFALAVVALSTLVPRPAFADDEEDAPDRRCLVLAEAGAGTLPTVTFQEDGKALVIPIEIRCENLDDASNPIRVESVEVEYRVQGDATADVPREHEQHVGQECGSEKAPLRVAVTLLSPEQKHRHPLRGLNLPVTYEARLSIEARQRDGRNRHCYGSMMWVFEVRPGASAE